MYCVKKNLIEKEFSEISDDIKKIDRCVVNNCIDVRACNKPVTKVRVTVVLCTYSITKHIATTKRYSIARIK